MCPRLAKGGALSLPASGASPALQPFKKEGPVTKRFFWNWDHSTEWELNKLGAQTFGCQNPYTRDPKVFSEDFTSQLQWCGRHGIDGTVIWGLLRDFHGGLESARALCETAAREKVRLLCGVGAAKQAQALRVEGLNADGNARHPGIP